jgi:hypothetical protein
MASPFFAPDNIPADTYKGVAGVRTLSVGAQWVTSDKADANTVYEITKALFSDSTQKALQAGHAKGKLITKENAVKSPGILFPPGCREVLQGSRADQVTVSAPGRHGPRRGLSGSRRERSSLAGPHAVRRVHK